MTPPTASQPEGGTGTESLIGRTIGERYKVTALLGSGGMGAVYAAIDERLEREVAVKVVRGSLAMEPTAVARFVREARASAALQHPAVVTIHDAGWSDGLPYIVMERLHGESLAARLRRARVGAQFAVQTMSRVLDALAVAHRAGIVHRDIKPENIFLCSPDDAPKLLDFGVASVTQPSGDAMRLTETGAGVGTPLYIAPEQLKGEAATAQADVYSIGAVLYEALSGRPAYAARTLPELYVKKITEPPPSLASAGTDLPAALIDIVDRSLARDPAQRPAGADVMRAELAAIFALPSAGTDAALAATFSRTPSPDAVRSANALLLAAATPTPSPTERRITQGESLPRPSLWWLWITVGVLLGAGAFGWRQVARSRSRAAHARTESARRAALATNVPASAPRLQPTIGLRTLTQYHDASGSARSQLSATDVWETAAGDFARVSTGGEMPVRWRSGRALCEGRVRVLRGDSPGAQERLRAAMEIEPEWAAPHVVLSEALELVGQTDAALASARRAAQLEPSWWLPVATLAAIHAAHARDDEAVPAYRRALALAPNEPAILDGLALALHGAMMDSEADRIVAQALARDPDLVWSHVVLAERALERNDPSTALTEATRATGTSPRAAAAQLARADALAALRRTPEALEVYRHVLALIDTAPQPGISMSRVALVRAAVAADRLPPSRAAADAIAARTRSVSAPAHTGSRTRGTGSRTRSGGGGSRTRAPDDMGNLGL